MDPASSPPRQPRLWTEEEDDLLRAEVAVQARRGRVNDWRRVASKVPGRSNKDCRKRWLKLDTTVSRGAWTSDEDDRLTLAVRASSHVTSNKWIEVSRAVGTRNADQCSKRWIHFLDPNLNYSEWSTAEDETLLAEVDKHGRNWKKIVGEKLKGRSATDAKNRYTILQRSRQKGMEQARASQQLQLSNVPPPEGLTTLENPRPANQDMATAAMPNDFDASSGDCMPGNAGFDVDFTDESLDSWLRNQGHNPFPIDLQQDRSVGKSMYDETIMASSASSAQHQPLYEQQDLGGPANSPLSAASHTASWTNFDDHHNFLGLPDPAPSPGDMGNLQPLARDPHSAALRYGHQGSIMASGLGAAAEQRRRPDAGPLMRPIPPSNTRPRNTSTTMTGFHVAQPQHDQISPVKHTNHAGTAVDEESLEDYSNTDEEDRAESDNEGAMSGVEEHRRSSQAGIGTARGGKGIVHNSHDRRGSTMVLERVQPDVVGNIVSLLSRSNSDVRINISREPERREPKKRRKGTR